MARPFGGVAYVKLFGLFDSRELGAKLKFGLYVKVKSWTSHRDEDL